MSKIRSHSNRSFSHETKQARIQHQIDEYAKKLQAQRRRINLYQEERKQIEEEMKKRKQGIFQYNKSLQSTKSKLSYTMTLNFRKKTDVFHKRNNKTIERINALKSLINKLRFEKRTTKETVQRCEQQLLEINRELQFQNNELQTKNVMMSNAKQQIIGLKSHIEEEQSSFIHKFMLLKKEFQQQRLRNTKNEGKLKQLQKYNLSDTSSLLRKKLQTIIVNNKEKMKMIDAYHRNMRILDDAFANMKQSSGLTDIKQIQTVFIKSQEQNCELLTYLNTLNQQIQKLEDDNDHMEQECDRLEQQNRQRQQLLNRVPEEQIKRQELESIENKRLQAVNQTTKLLSDLSPNVFQCIAKLKGNYQKKQPVMNMLNYQKIIKELEDAVNFVIVSKSKKFGRNLIEDTSEFDKLNSKLDKKVSDSNYSPNYQFGPENKSGLLDYDKMKEIAMEAMKQGYIEKEKERGGKTEREKLLISRRSRD